MPQKLLLTRDNGSRSGLLRFEELEKIFQQTVRATFDVGEGGIDVTEKVVSMSACTCSAFVVTGVEFDSRRRLRCNVRFWVLCPRTGL